MSSTGAGNLNPEPVARLVRNGRIVNKILASICVQENLSKIGVKAELQNRIIEKLYHYADNNDTKKFERLKTMIENPRTIPTNGQFFDVATSSPAVTVKDQSTSVKISSATPSPGNIHANNFNNMGRGGNRVRTLGSQAIQLKPSPYYTFVDQLGPTVICEVMASHRFTSRISLSNSQYPLLSRVSQEPNLRVMVFCASEGSGPQDIAFPHQSEIKVNGGEIKANLRGLKNKPGSTRPVDITGQIRFNPPSYVNNIEMMYALTNKKFYLMVFVAQVVSVSSLVQKLANGQKITEKSVLDDMLNKSRDTDIIATSSVLSLKCPLSTMRIDLPCRSISCRHTQCFDATSYLQLQEQGPTWSCPICNNPASFESLAVDEYVKKILQNTFKSVEQVTIQPDGKWELNAKNDKSNSKRTPNNSEDEVVEITTFEESINPRPFNTLKGAQVLKPVLIDPIKTNEAPQSSSGTTNTKRPIATVIDLTSSTDEDDDPPVRPHKRHHNNTGHSMNHAIPPHRALQKKSHGA